MAVAVLVALEDTRYNKLQRMSMPPLGLLSLAAFAREKRPGKDSFLLIDESAKPRTDAQWAEILKSVQPDIIGISCLTLQSNTLAQKAALFKKIAPGIPVVVGGPHATAIGTSLLQTPGIDYMVMGEGELGFAGLLDALERGEKYPEDAIQGLAFVRPDKSIKQNPHNKNLLDVNTLPLPAWDLVCFDDYAKLRRMMFMEQGSPYATIMTSRGCPYSCTYCHNIFGKSFRPMSANRVLENIEHLVNDYGINNFQILDDIFNLDYGRVLEICRLIQERGIKIRFCFPNGLRTDLLDKKILTQMQKAGAYSICVAVETADKDIQKQIRKNLDLEKVKKNIAIAADLGLFTWGFFMLGFPGETKQQMEKTVQYALKSKLHGALFQGLVPFPGTAIAGEERLSTDEALALSTNVNYLYKSGGLSAISPKELNRIQTWAFARFFLAPRRMIRIWRDYPAGKLALLRMALYFFWYLAFFKRPEK
jgi:radical SAM superfamily enzyme YgiQ (UPF0313 family)